MNKFLELFKDKTVYHISDSDTDGILGIVVSEIYIEPLCKVYLPYSNSDREFKDLKREDIAPFDTVLFTDISPTKELYEYLISKDKQVIICDHHDTGRDELKDYYIEHYYYSENDSATYLLFSKIFEGSRPPKIVKDVATLVSVYDTWQKDSPLWKKANDFVDYHLSSKKYGTDDEYKANYQFIKRMKLKLKFNSEFNYSLDEIRAIKERKDKRNDAYKKMLKTMKKRLDKNGNYYMFCELSSGVSVLGNRLLEENKDCKYVVIYNTYFKVKPLMKMSLRSTGDFDTREISESWGGGGHKNASSFHFKNEEDFKNFIKGEIDLIL